MENFKKTLSILKPKSKEEIDRTINHLLNSLSPNQLLKFGIKQVYTSFIKFAFNQGANLQDLQVELEEELDLNLDNSDYIFSLEDRLMDIIL